jgi:hypothetical protein
MNWIVWLLFLFEIVHILNWLLMASSTTTSTKRRDCKIFENRAPQTNSGLARRETGRKRKETPAMAEFMNEQLTKKETRSETESNNQLAPRISFTSNIVDNDNGSNRSRITRRSNSTARRTSRSVACRRADVSARTAATEETQSRRDAGRRRSAASRSRTTTSSRAARQNRCRRTRRAT